MKEFSSSSISPEDWDSMDGAAVCSLTQEEFRRKVPIDPNDLMWTHVELLRMCKFVAVVQKWTGPFPKPTVQKQKGNKVKIPTRVVKSFLVCYLTNRGILLKVIPRQTIKKPPVRLGMAKFTVMSESALGNCT